jgi:Zn finger protein HypA/HybF involved in hydrogenase expression
MHEHGLADHILETVLHHPDRPQQAVPRAITVLVAELGGISQDALQANLDHVCEHHGLPQIELRVESVPLLGCCNACQETSPLGEELVCPACGSAEVRLCGGETIVISTCNYT